MKFSQETELKPGRQHGLNLGTIRSDLGWIVLLASLPQTKLGEQTLSQDTYIHKSGFSCIPCLRNPNEPVRNLLSVWDSD